MDGPAEEDSQMDVEENPLDTSQPPQPTSAALLPPLDQEKLRDSCVGFSSVAVQSCARSHSEALDEALLSTLVPMDELAGLISGIQRSFAQLLAGGGRGVFERAVELSAVFAQVDALEERVALVRHELMMLEERTGHAEAEESSKEIKAMVNKLNPLAKDDVHAVAGPKAIFHRATDILGRLATAGGSSQPPEQLEEKKE